MDRRQVERRLERAFRSAPLRYGEAQVRERKKPFGLAQTILPAGKPQSYRECRHGNVLEELEQLGVGTRRLLSLAYAAALVKGITLRPLQGSGVAVSRIEQRRSD